MKSFGIPVVLFLFKRIETTLRIVDRLAQVRPSKLYLISDGPRNESERAEIIACRTRVEAQINWPCDVIKNYAEENKGVYDRIGLGAMWVLRQEAWAIFIEDDNLPELTFFNYCEEMLRRYEKDTRVLWVCGTNYLKRYRPADGSSYVFTRHMLPCGWASWAHKFARFYEGDLSLLDDPLIRKRVCCRREDRALTKQHMESWSRERRNILTTGRASSWDHQMAFSLRVHGLFGIAPKFNQIKNIGVDEFSTHGATTKANIMTRRFCELETVPLDFPLVHPKVVGIDQEFEALTGEIILLPRVYRLRGAAVKAIKRLLLVDDQDSLIQTLRQRLSKLRG